MYSLDSGEKSQKKSMGIKRLYVEKNVRHRDFLTELKREENPALWHNLARSSPLNTEQMSKLCLNAFDDKCFILEDRINTSPYGNHRID